MKKINIILIACVHSALTVIFIIVFAAAVFPAMQASLSESSVIGLSFLYFAVVGIFEAYVIQPIMDHFLIRGSRHVHMNNKMSVQGIYVFRAMMILLYIAFMKNYSKKKKVAEKMVENPTDA